MLWNPLIGSTLAYALQTKENNHAEILKLEQFTSKCIRQIDDPNWHQKNKSQSESTFIRYGSNRQYTPGYKNSQ